jgi:Phage gp6-like head-tail connector protein
MIVSLSEFKTYLGITDNSQDSLLQLLLDSAQSSVESFTGRKFEADLTDITEIFDGNAQKEIFLNKYPIISLTSVDYNAGDTSIADWQEVVNTGYSIKSNI